MGQVTDRNVILVIISAFFMLVMVSTFFLDIKPIAAFASESRRMFIPIIGMATVVGSINLLLHYLQVIQKRKKDWQLAIILIATYVLFLVITLIPSLQVFSSNLYLMTVGVISECTKAMVALFMVSVSFRAFKIKTFETGLFAASCVLILLGNAPVGDILFPGASDLLQWIMNVPTMSAMRAITIGVGLGILAFGIRVMIGSDRTVLGEF